MYTLLPWMSRGLIQKLSQQTKQPRRPLSHLAAYSAAALDGERAFRRRCDASIAHYLKKPPSWKWGSKAFSLSLSPGFSLLGSLQCIIWTVKYRTSVQKRSMPDDHFSVCLSDGKRITRGQWNTTCRRVLTDSRYRAVLPSQLTVGASLPQPQQLRPELTTAKPPVQLCIFTYHIHCFFLHDSSNLKELEGGPSSRTLDESMFMYHVIYEATTRIQVGLLNMKTGLDMLNLPHGNLRDWDLKPMQKSSLKWSQNTPLISCRPGRKTLLLVFNGLTSAPPMLQLFPIFGLARTAKICDGWIATTPSLALLKTTSLFIYAVFNRHENINL